MQVGPEKSNIWFFAISGSSKIHRIHKHSNTCHVLNFHRNMIVTMSSIRINNNLKIQKPPIYDSTILLKGCNSSLSWRDPYGKLTDQSLSWTSCKNISMFYVNFLLKYTNEFEFESLWYDLWYDASKNRSSHESWALENKYSFVKNLTYS